MKHNSAFIDVQEGKKGEGFHLWMGVDRWDDANGESRRLYYDKLKTWGEAKDIQLSYAVENKNVGVDAGGGTLFNQVITQTHRFGWYAYKGDEAINYTHWIKNEKGEMVGIKRPWSEMSPHDPLSGKSVAKIAGKAQMKRFAYLRNWSNPSVYPIFYALKNGGGRYYGIAKNMSAEYLSQVNSHIPDSKGGWMKVNPEDHAWDVGCGNLLISLIRGWFRLE